MEWDNKTEEMFKELVYRVTRAATANILNMVDTMKYSDDTRVGDLKKIDSMKSAFRSIIMNFQSELLYGIKLVIETGQLPKPIDKRGHKSVQHAGENKCERMEEAQ